MRADDAELVVSVASLWEIAIKVRAGKLAIEMELTELPALCAAASASVLPIESRHVLADAQPQPDTRDPFDRILLAQAQCDG